MITPLLGAIADFHRGRPERDFLAMTDMVIDALDAAVVTSAPLPDPKPVVRHLADVVNDAVEPAVRRIVDEFLAVATQLPWVQTTGYLDVLPADYLENYGYVRLLGPGGVIAHDHVTVGIGLWGPNLYYPMHEHPAEELYHVLSGRPRFRTDDTEFEVRPPGDAVHHLPWHRHAQQFGDTPTLLLYAWTGDITTDARIVSD